MLKKAQILFWAVTLSLSSLAAAIIILLLTAAFTLVFSATAHLFCRWFAQLNSPP